MKLSALMRRLAHVISMRVPVLDVGSVPMPVPFRENPSGRGKQVMGRFLSATCAKAGKRGLFALRCVPVKH